MGKIFLWRTFNRNPSIRPYLPATELYRPGVLPRFLNAYHSVYIKPDGGGMGIGVIKVWKTSSGFAFIKEKGAPVHCASLAELKRKLAFTSKRPHIIQQSIDLAKINGRRYDIRMMTMRNQEKKWIYAGALAKVAGKSSIITNVARGKGYAVELDHALRQSLGLRSGQIASKRNEMLRLCLACCRMHDKIRYDWQIGYDLGIDRKGKIWLIESNPRFPSHALFARLQNKTMFRRIKYLAALNRKKRN